MVLGESETAARQEGRILVRRALPSPDVDEHLQVGEKSRERLAGIVGDVSLHEEETGTSAIARRQFVRMPTA